MSQFNLVSPLLLAGLARTRGDRARPCWFGFLAAAGVFSALGLGLLLLAMTGPRWCARTATH
jgi:hypothetical protein